MFCIGLFTICCKCFCKNNEESNLKFTNQGKQLFWENLSEISIINEISLYKNQRITDKNEAKNFDNKYWEILEDLMNKRMEI